MNGPTPAPGDPVGAGAEVIRGAETPRPPGDWFTRVGRTPPQGWNERWVARWRTWPPGLQRLASAVWNIIRLLLFNSPHAADADSAIASSDDLTRQALDETLEEAALEGPRERPATDAGPPPEENVEKPGSAEKDVAQASESRSRDALPRGLDSFAAQEQFLRSREALGEEYNARLLKDERETRQRERLLFWALACVGLITAAAALAAVVLALSDRAPTGAVTGAIALVPAAGTVMLRRLLRQVGSQRRSIQTQRLDNQRILDSVQVTMMMTSETEREKSFGELSRKLIERIDRA